MKSLLLNFLKSSCSFKDSHYCNKSVNNIKFTKVKSVDLPSQSNQHNAKPISLSSTKEISNKISISNSEAYKLYKDCSWLLDSYYKGINNLTKEEVTNLNTLEDHLKNKIKLPAHLDYLTTSQRNFKSTNLPVEISEYILNNAYPCIKEYRENINKPTNQERH